jgi:DNA topoisomerase VI, B subunit
MNNDENITAHELAKNQKSISVAEFFEKNKQILGFDSAPRSLFTTVKEAVDNSLDACEESGILPEITVHIKKSEKKNLIVIIEDNGPGIVNEQIPKVFAKLLYGSKFHVLKQSRGQQGIGISASVLYSQLTSGNCTKVISKIDDKKPAHYYELLINTSTNEPEVLNEDVVDWDRPHGTRIEMEMVASYVKGRKHSIYNYLKLTAIVNPHAQITLIESDGEKVVFERATDKLPVPAKEIMPHPHGIEIGTLMKMLKNTTRQRLYPFLRYSFAKIGHLAADEICTAAKIDPEIDPHEISRDQVMRLIQAFSKVKIMSPPTNCLSPIGQDLVKKGLDKEYYFDFVATTTRDPVVHSGNPFIVEVGIAYGGNLKKDGAVEIMRFANKVPLLYQQGGCVITQAIESIKWKQYGLSQKGGGLPTGPVVILVHVASTNIPFTSESKDAVANIPEIKAEIENAIKEVARKLSKYKNSINLLKKKSEKEIVITKILPKLAKNVANIVDREIPDIIPVIAKIMGNVLVNRVVEPDGNEGAKISIGIRNFSTKKQQLKIHEIVPFEIRNPAPDPEIRNLRYDYDYTWNVSVPAGNLKVLTYHVPTLDEIEIEHFSELIVEGNVDCFVNGAREE